MIESVCREQWWTDSRPSKIRGRPRGMRTLKFIRVHPGLGWGPEISLQGGERHQKRPLGNALRNSSLTESDDSCFILEGLFILRETLPPPPYPLCRGQKGLRVLDLHLSQTCQELSLWLIICNSLAFLHCILACIRMQGAFVSFISFDGEEVHQADIKDRGQFWFWGPFWPWGSNSTSLSFCVFCRCSCANLSSFTE